jgi:hypothetical protein
MSFGISGDTINTGSNYSVPARDTDENRKKQIEQPDYTLFNAAAGGYIANNDAALKANSIWV